jgi:putative membrane protein
MIYLKALHLIALVLWFSGLFYLPRLFVYHTMQQSQLMQHRFVQLEYNLCYYVMLPGGLITLLTGVILLQHKFPAGVYPLWLLLKISMVIILSLFHCYLSYLQYCFAKQQNQYSELFFRYLNEVPTVLLVIIVFLAIFHPVLWQ